VTFRAFWINLYHTLTQQMASRENLWRGEFVFRTARVKLSTRGLFISLNSWMKQVAKKPYQSGPKLLG